MPGRPRRWRRASGTSRPAATACGGSTGPAEEGLIGFCGCQFGDDGRAELLYGLTAAWWGQGLATECAGAVLDHLFGPLGLTEVMALTDAPNTASARVMERLGMTFERRGDHHGLDTVFYRLGAGRLAGPPHRGAAGGACRRTAAAVADAATGRLPAAGLAHRPRDRRQRSPIPVRGPPRAPPRRAASWSPSGPPDAASA